jgi:DNA invertase Pin-like site-specific DNA recombinase
VRQLRDQGRNIAEIARIVGITRQTAYRLLGQQKSVKAKTETRRTA